MQGELASIHHSFRNLDSGAQAHRRAVSKQPDGCIGLCITKLLRYFTAISGWYQLR